MFHIYSHKFRAGLEAVWPPICNNPVPGVAPKGPAYLKGGGGNIMNSARRLQHRTGTQEWGEGGVISYLRGIKSAGPSASNTVLKPDWMTAWRGQWQQLLGHSRGHREGVRDHKKSTNVNIVSLNIFKTIKNFICVINDSFRSLVLCPRTFCPHVCFVHRTFCPQVCFVHRYVFSTGVFCPLDVFPLDD